VYISKVILENYKGYSGIHTFNFNKGVNYFVGNNNCGKSTVFEAIEFIKTKKSKEDTITKNSIGEVSVTVEFRGDVEEAVKNSGLSKYESYLVDDDGEKVITLQRSSKQDEIVQNKKPKTLSIKDVRVYNETSKQFENPTGVDKTIGALFETQFIWADTNPNDVSDFGSTKICGRLVMGAAQDFYKSPQWTAFKEVHRDTFTKGKDSLSAKVKPLESKLQEIITEQYGDTEVKFDFSLPDVASFTKSGTIKMIDNEIETDSSEKGTGMQRALALALIQVYADTLTKVGAEEAKSKPLLFFIDEPETFLHPKAQDKLMKAFEKISSSSQVFITTHSPYLLKKYSPKDHSLTVFSKTSSGNKADPSSSLGLFGASSPTWGEINYFAFDFATVEFHNELYGFAEARAKLNDSSIVNQKDFDDYLEALGCSKNKTWTRSTSSSYATTIQNYIRNSIHHPENKLNTEYTGEELQTSIEEFLTLNIPLI